MNLQVIKKRLRKILAYSFTSIAFVLISAFLVLQIPAVQQFLIQKYLRSFSNVIGFTTTVESFELLWFDRLELQGVKIIDPENNEMINVESILINFELSHLVEQRDINIDGISIKKAHVLVTRIHQSDTSTNLNINEFVDRINEKYSGSGGGQAPIINIGEAILEESVFSYIDQERDSIKTGFNYNQFTVDIDESQLQNFLILGDTTQFQLNTMLARDRKTGFNITQLSTFFRLSQQSMEFLGLNLQAGESVVNDTIIFNFNGQRELSDFISKVRIHGHLDNTILEPKDLALFAPEVEKIEEPIALKGSFNGRIDRFRFTDMEIQTGKTILKGSVEMDGLPDINETFIFLKLNDSQLHFDDIAFLFDEEVLNRLTPIGRVEMDGEFVGYPNDFVAKGDFVGDLGRITSDINFKVNERDFDRSEYSGKLALDNFQLGRYLKDTTNFQVVNLNGNVKGSGLSLKTADFILYGKIQSIGIRHYNYSNISTNARFASQLFNGFITIADPNLQFTAKGSVDLRNNVNKIQIDAELDTALLHNLKLTKDFIFLHSGISMNIKGLHLDSITGVADLKDLRVGYKKNKLNLEQVHITSVHDGKNRDINLKTNLVSAGVKGDFLLTDISKDLQTLVREIILNIKNDKSAIEHYYENKTYRPKTYQADFVINMHDVRPITALFNTEINVSKNSSVEGKFSSGYTSILQAYTDIDTLTFNRSVFIHNNVEVTASKIADSTNVLAMAFANSGRQLLTSRLRTTNLVTEAIWNNNHIDFTLDGDQEGQSNYLRLAGAIDFLKDSTQLKIRSSTLKLLEKVWEFDQDNLITLSHGELKVDRLRMQNEKQFISADGTISRDPSKTLELQVKDFELGLLKPIIGRQISGVMNATINVNDYFDNPSVENSLKIDSLTFANFLIGNITGENRWDTLQHQFLIDFFVDRGGSKIVNVNGSYNPEIKESPLDVTAELRNANLKIIEPFLEDILTNIGGTVSGDFKITGHLDEPQLRGEGNVPNGQLTVNYLKTHYTFNGIVGLTPHSIYFEGIELNDIFNNKGKLGGTISHDNFFNMRINLDASFTNFQVLNTTARDNSLFYGQGYASGDLNIYGPVANLKITANARTDRNTRISIPIGETSEVEKKEFIKFVSFTDSTYQQSLAEEINNKIDLTGVTFDFNLDVTPDAYCEIIFDIKAGDIIRGRGNGDLQFQLDTKGEFNMFGPFEFTEGWYNFTLYDIINKDFQIKKGSRINWYGDAYQGILDISASYNQLASFLPILTDQTLTNQPQLRRKYPVQVLLELDGPMLSPQINFDIVATDLPQSIVVEGRTSPVRLAFEFQAFKNKMDEQELKRQVFSLIVLRRFSPPESFNTSGSLANSVSELLSNQLSNWISQVDENLEIDIDMSSFDQEAFNTFQLRLSYTLLNGRLRITRDATTFYGNQNNGTNTNQQQNNLASIAGDWTVDYLLTPDGKFRVKMYNRSNINPILNTLNNQNAVTTGVSISHVQSFNQLRDIWRAARNRRKNQPPPVEQEAEADDAASKDKDGSR
jgi:hypothetical protein